MLYLILLVGILFGAELSAWLDPKIEKYDKAIELCERELPRNQECEITGKLKEK